MTATEKPKRALIAYCVMAERLRASGGALSSALIPFISEACKPFSGQYFDAAKISANLKDMFDFDMPRLAILGFAEQLAAEGVLIRQQKDVYLHATVNISATAENHLSEEQVQRVLDEFTAYCHKNISTTDLSDEFLWEAFRSRLLRIDSMRIITRKDSSITAKRTPNTLGLKRKNEDFSPEELLELHIDFMVSQFILDLRNSNDPLFEVVSDVAFASMAAEAVANFREPSQKTGLDNLTVYLDSPLLLDILGVNSEYSEYGDELLQTIVRSGAKAAAFDDSISEAENTIFAMLESLSSGVNRNSVRIGGSIAPDHLMSLRSNVAPALLKRHGVETQRDPENTYSKSYPQVTGDIEIEMERRMGAWGNEEAKRHDRRSIWSLLTLRDYRSPTDKVCDSRFLFLTRNSALVNIANDCWRRWLRVGIKHADHLVESRAPIALSDKQFAGYVWLRSGNGTSEIPLARLLAHCSSAVRPRADVKAAAINMALELNDQKAADDLAALLEDREGARALMRATKGDPHDITKDRLPFILEQVRLAAGEYAAQKEREESNKKIEAQSIAHEEAIKALSDKHTQNLASRAATESDNALKLKKASSEIERLGLENSNLSGTVYNLIEQERAKNKLVLQRAYRYGRRIYSLLRWTSALFIGFIAYAIAYYPIESKALYAFASGAVVFICYWFIPSFLSKPFNAVAEKAMKTWLLDRGYLDELPKSKLNFDEETWEELEN